MPLQVDGRAMQTKPGDHAVTQFCWAFVEQASCLFDLKKNRQDACSTNININTNINTNINRNSRKTTNFCH